jgi:hypothetical protein
VLSGAVQHEADGVDQVAGEQPVQRVDDPGLVRVAAHEHIAAAADAARVERHEQQQIHRGQRRSAPRRQAAAAAAAAPALIPSAMFEECSRNCPLLMSLILIDAMKVAKNRGAFLLEARGQRRTFSAGPRTVLRSEPSRREW